MSDIKDFVINEGNLEKYRGCDTDLVIPDGVECISEGVFENCEYLKSVTIPDSVKKIEDRAFINCENLSDIRIGNNIEQVGVGVFAGTAYANNPANWCGYFLIINDVIFNVKKDISGHLTIPDGIKCIADSAFFMCLGIKSVVIPESMTRIGESLFAYCSSLEKVELSKSIKYIDKEAFKSCDKLSNINLTDKIVFLGEAAFYDCNLKGVHIPKGIKIIKKRTFYGCAFEEIIIPNGVMAIEEIAFGGCEANRIIIPESVEKIGTTAFDLCNYCEFQGFEVDENNKYYSSIDGVLYNKSLDILIKYPSKNDAECFYIPNSIKSIGDSAFANCNLKKIVIPDGVETIEDGAFNGLGQLYSVGSISIDIKGTIDTWAHMKLYRNMLDYCNVKLTINGENVDVVTINKNNVDGFKIENFKNMEGITFKALPEIFEDVSFKLPVSLVGLLDESNIEAVACVFLYQSAKAWIERVEEILSKDNADKFILKLSDLLIKQEKITKATTNKIVKFVLLNSDLFKKAALVELNKALLSRQQNNQDLKNLIDSKTDVTDETEYDDDELKTIIRNYNKNCEEYSDAEKLVKNVIHLCDSENYCSKEMLCIIFAEYLKEWKRVSIERPGQWGTTNVLESGEKLEKQEIADKLIRELDYKEFIDFLKKGVTGKSYRKYLLPFVSCAIEDDVEWFVGLIKNLSRGKAKDKLQAANCNNALLLNDSRAAGLYFDQIGWLKVYAKMRNMTPDELRTSVVYNFDLDEFGKKQYDLGNTKVEVSLCEDLTFAVTDLTTGKVYKSIPKRGSDNDKYEVVSNDFNGMKTYVKRVTKNSISDLFYDFLLNKTTKFDIWQKKYFENAVLKQLSKLIVWSQSGVNFIVTNEGCVDCDGKAVVLKKDRKIGIAHPVDMTKDEVLKWQNYFLNNDLKQPFIQIWEPIIKEKSIQANRYERVELPLYRFSNKEKHGIVVDKDVEYDYRWGEYKTTDISIILYGISMEWEFVNDSVSTANAQSLIRINSIKVDEFNRISNHIIGYLDKVTIIGRIHNQDETIIDVLENYTAAQIQEFIDVAIESNLTSMSALLLEYKNIHFSGFDNFDKFVL